MGKNTNINIRINEDIKNEALLIFKSLGLNLSSAIDLFFRQVINNNGLPFNLSNEPANLNKAMFEVKEQSTKPTINNTSPKTDQDLNLIFDNQNSSKQFPINLDEVLALFEQGKISYDEAMTIIDNNFKNE